MKKQSYWKLIAADIISKLTADDITLKTKQIADREELNEAQTQMLRNRLIIQRKYFDFELVVKFKDPSDANILATALERNAKDKKENETWGAFLRAKAIQKHAKERKKSSLLPDNF